MVGDFTSSFLGTLTALGAGAVVLRYLSARFVEHQLGKALAEHRHELDKKLAALQADIGRFSDVVSRRNEREFSITEGAWERMIRAVGAVQNEFGPFRHASGLEFQSDQEAEAYIATLDFTEPEKETLRNTPAPKREEVYERLRHARGVRRAQEVCGEFKNWLSTRQIFLEENIYREFITIRDEVFKVVTRARMHKTLDEIPTATHEKIDDILLNTLNERVDALAAVIRERFGFEKRSTQNTMASTRS